MNDNPVQNTDRELWRKIPGDFYSPSIHVTRENGIGINCGGNVIVATVEVWHDVGETLLAVNERVPSWHFRLAKRLLRGQIWRPSGAFHLRPFTYLRFGARLTKVRAWLWWERNLP